MDESTGQDMFYFFPLNYFRNVLHCDKYFEVNAWVKLVTRSSHCIAWSQLSSIFQQRFHIFRKNVYVFFFRIERNWIVVK